MINQLAFYFLLSYIFIGMPLEKAIAQPTQPIIDASGFQFSPPDSGLPENTTGGASRVPDICRQQTSVSQASRIILLAPSDFIGLTISDRPSFFLYADQTPANQIFVSVRDEKGKELYHGFQRLTASTGLFRIDLPVSMPALRPGHTYRLSVVPMCEEFLQPDDPVITTYVRRITSPQTYVDTLESSFELAILYADLGIWYDTLALLEQGLRNQPRDRVFTAAWESLLVSGGIAGTEAEGILP